MKWFAVQEEKIAIAGRPVRVLRPETKTDKAMVFYHGWSSSAALNVFRGKILAAHGYVVLVPEAVHHGERGTLDYEDGTVVAAHMFSVIDRSAREFSDLKDWLNKEGCSRILVTGHSMGGFTAARVFAAYTDLTACVNLNGCFAFHDAAEGLFAKAGPEQEKALRDAFVPYETDPQEQTEHLVNRPILLINGAADAVIDPDWQKAFYENLREKYEDPDRIRRIRMENQGHFVTTNMLEELLAFARTYMEDPA